RMTGLDEAEQGVQPSPLHLPGLQPSYQLERSFLDRLVILPLPDLAEGRALILRYAFSRSGFGLGGFKEALGFCHRCLDGALGLDQGQACTEGQAVFLERVGEPAPEFPGERKHDVPRTDHDEIVTTREDGVDLPPP